MLEPITPASENDRIDALQALQVLDTPPEERFDRFTRLAKRLFHAPIALVSLVDTDRQWFKSRQGLEATETPRNISFCGHAILQDEVLVVMDTATDVRFSDNPLVLGEPGIRFYAGSPLRAPGGAKIGTLCIIDTQPRDFDPDDISLLQIIAEMVELDLASATLATTDELTGLSNRRGLRAIASHAMARAQREQVRLAMLYFDLDDFKPINDSFGHAAGDAALSTFARLLINAFRECDIVARLGGDEFCVLLSNVDEVGVALVLSRMNDVVAAFNASSGEPYELAFSAGQAFVEPSDDYDIDSLLARADAAMYEAKKQRPIRSAAA